MKKVLLGALSVLAAALVIPAAFAASGPVNKVNGDVTFTNLGLTQHWVFNAQEGTTKGSVLDEWNGGTTISKIVSADVIDAKTATFTTEVTSSVNNPYAHVGDRFTYTVHDLGQSTTENSGDYMTFDGWTPAGGTFQPNGGDYPITSANIQIHFEG